jgi:hypothetical protein
MGRNKLIYALTALTLVVATSEGSGGTWAGIGAHGAIGSVDEEKWSLLDI